MRAAVVRQFGGIENIAVEADYPIPELTEKQVLVNVKAAGVNPVDTYIRAGTYAQLPQLPYTPGREGAGVIHKVGGEVTNWKEGDRVWFVNPVTGPSADYCVVDEGLAFKLAENVSFVQGSTLGVAYFTAYKALFMKAGAQAGQTLFIHGISGGVGLAAAQLGKAHGLRVFGTAGTEEGAELARQNGAERVFNHREEGYVTKIQEEFPNGFDVILEMLANVNLGNDLQLAACQAKIVVVGNRGTIEIDPRQCMQKEASIIGVLGGLTSTEDYQRMGERLVGLLEGGHVSPFVGQVLPLKQLPEAHRILTEGKGAHGKIVVNLELD